MVIVGKHINGIALNPLEYLLGKDGREMAFINVETAKAFLKEKGFSDDELECLVFETLPISGEVHAKLEKAVEYIVKKCTNETTSGTYIVHADDFPVDILTPGLFAEHIATIADLMLGYESIADVDVEDGAISTIIYTDYCPNYTPAPDEAAKFPDDRETLDPLAKKQFMDAYASVRMVEDLMTQAEKLFNEIPPDIRQAIHFFHNENATIQYCLRWGLEAVADVRKDWHAIVANIPCGCEGGGI